MGLPDRPREQLASADVALACARLPGVWREAGRDAPGKCRASCGEYSAAVPGIARADRRALAKCPGGGAIRAAPVARGIGGLGVGTQGRAEHALLPAHDMGVWVLREGPKSEF